MTTFSVDGQRLSADLVADLADRPLQVTVTEAAFDRVRRSHEPALRNHSERPLYGRNTGVGANRDMPIEPSVSAAQALLTSHATSAGPPRSGGRARAMLLVRLNQLCAGGAGVSPE